MEVGYWTLKAPKECRVEDGEEDQSQEEGAWSTVQDKQKNQEASSLLACTFKEVEIVTEKRINKISLFLRAGTWLFHLLFLVSNMIELYKQIIEIF